MKQKHTKYTRKYSKKNHESRCTWDVFSANSRTVKLSTVVKHQQQQREEADVFQKHIYSTHFLFTLNYEKSAAVDVSGSDFMWSVTHSTWHTLQTAVRRVLHDVAKNTKWQTYTISQKLPNVLNEIVHGLNS